MPEAFPGAIITFPMLGESFSLNPSGTYTLFGHTFYWYGAIIGLGFILAALYCMRRAPKDFGISKDTLTDVVLIGLPTAIVGARLYYVFCHWSSYVGDTVWQTLWNWCKIWEGGTAIPGGLLLATFCVWLYARKKKIPFGAIMDCVVLGLLIGQIIGRWSNFMNREYIGEVTDVFCRMGLIAPDGSTIYVHPTFLYESLWNLCILIFLIIFERKGKRSFDGQCITLYFLLYGIGRTWIEGLRTDSLYIGGTDIRVSQALSAVLAFIALVLLIVNARREHKPEDLFVNHQAAAACTIAGAEDKKPET